MAEICCEAVAEGLRTVQATSLVDLREAFAMQRTMLHMVQRLHHRITTGNLPCAANMFNQPVHLTLCALPTSRHNLFDPGFCRARSICGASM